MEVLETEISEVKIVIPKVFGDARGYFFESWNHERYAECGIDCKWCQDNESKSRFGVLRGLHDSKKYPRASPKIFGTMILTSGIAVLITSMIQFSFMIRSRYCPYSVLSRS